MKKRKEKVGGMALFNGLMLRNKKREAVGKVDNNKNITVDITELNDKYEKYDCLICSLCIKVFTGYIR